MAVRAIIKQCRLTLSLSDAILIHAEDMPNMDIFSSDFGWYVAIFDLTAYEKSQS